MITNLGRLYGGEKVVYERHRHRYEVNPKYVSQIEAKGLKFVATDSNCERMEIVENPGKNFEFPSVFRFNSSVS